MLCMSIWIHKKQPTQQTGFCDRDSSGGGFLKNIVPQVITPDIIFFQILMCK